MQSIIKFIKYNNAFTIIIALIFFSAGGAFANETVRDAVIGQTIVTKNGTDNTRIISADLGNFDMGLRIKSVKEDDKFYYVDFDYKTIDAVDGVWKETIKEKNMNVSKAGLKDTDLGVYLAEELKQLTDKEMAYMKEVQSIEKNKGLQRQTESTEYTGLKGLVFNNETKELEGYKPVKEEKEDKAIVINAAALAGDKQNDSAGASADAEKTGPQVTVVKEELSKETIMKMVKDALAQEKSGNASSINASSSASSSSPAVPGGGGGVGTQSSSNSSSFSSSQNSSSSMSSSSVTASSSSESSSSSVSSMSSSSETASSTSNSSQSSTSSSSSSVSVSSSPSSSSSMSSSSVTASSSSEASSSSTSSSSVSESISSSSSAQSSSSVSETSSSSSVAPISSSSASSTSSI